MHGNTRLAASLIALLSFTAYAQAPATETAPAAPAAAAPAPAAPMSPPPAPTDPAAIQKAREAEMMNAARLVFGMAAAQQDVERIAAYCGKMPAHTAGAKKALAGWQARNRDVLEERRQLLAEMGQDPAAKKDVAKRLAQIRTDANQAGEKREAQLNANSTPQERQDFCRELLARVDGGAADLAQMSPEAYSYTRQRIMIRAGTPKGEKAKPAPKAPAAN